MTGTVSEAATTKM